MPLFEYQCDACGKRFEQIHQKFSDAQPDVCQHCGKGPVHRLLSSPAIQFKGSGWYITDYAKKSAPESGATGEKGEKGEKAGKGDTADKSGKTESAAAPEKAETKSGTSESKTPPPATPSGTTSKD